MVKGIIKVLLLALASGLTAVAVAATLTDGPLTEVGALGRAAPAPGWGTTGGSIAATSRTTAERRTCEVFDDTRYLVRTGDTLWGIASRYYNDASTAMRRIKRRNGLRRETLLADEVLVLPAAGRRIEGAQADAACPADEAATESAPPAP